MSMPQIPENKHRPNLQCTIIDLLESIAMEEMSLSHLLNAEAEKIQAFVGKNLDFPLCSSPRSIIAFSRISSEFMTQIIMKQWLLMNKLNTVIEIGEEDDKCKDKGKNNCDCNCGDCTRPLNKFCQKK